jgi:transposase
MGSLRHELTEGQWQRIKDLLPPDQGQVGRRPRPNRVMVNAILWVLKSGAPWRDLPLHYPKWKSVHTRFLRWSKRGVWKRVLDQLAVDLDDELAILDASIVRVHQDAAGGKRNGTECIGRSRGGPSTKIHAVVDGLGNPTKVEITEGQVHDVTQAPKMLEDATSTSVLADKGYDSNAVVAQIESQGSRAVIPPRRGRVVDRPYDRDLFKSRFLVEQFFAKLKRCRRVATRYEKLAVTFLAMVLLACILVWLA